MQRAFADDTERRAFAERLEAMLREGEAEAALALVRQGLEAIADHGLPIVDIALTTDPDTLVLTGWDDVGKAIAREDSRGKAITAIGIDVSWPGHIGLQPDANGHMAPHIETNLYADLGDVAFSTATRAEILEGYSGSGSTWQGCFVDIDDLIGIEGLSALYGLVADAAGDRDSDDAAGDAYVLAACTSAVLLHIAVKRAIVAGALPRPMAVLVGSNEDFPFFDAPVVSVDEARALMPARPATPPAPPPITTQDGVSGHALRSRLGTSDRKTDPPDDPSATKGFFGKLFGR